MVAQFAVIRDALHISKQVPNVNSRARKPYELVYTVSMENAVQAECDDVSA